MKKSLIALAALAATGAAMAQSSVTMYGVVDAYVGSLKDTITGGGSVATRQNVVNANGMRNSRWGIKGTEDLGGGLKANFVLEQGFATDSGAANSYDPNNHSATGNTKTSGFDREANVGLSGNFGAVKLGRVYSAYDDFRAITNNTADHNFAATRDVWGASGKGEYTIRFSNAVRYDTPAFGGFSGAVAVGLGENKNGVDNANQDSTDLMSLHVKYANGPLTVGYAHQSEEKLGGVSSTRYNVVGASYDFGVAKLTGSYNKVKAASSMEDTEYQLGVSAPIGAAINLYAGYAHAKGETAGTKNGESNGYDLLAVYSLSKRTDLYTGYKSVTDKNAAGAKEGEKKQFALGVRHVF